jgi:hypothetical protein
MTHLRLLQNLTELDQFRDLIRANGVRSYLEIGCKFGESVWEISRVLPAGALIVGVDLPLGDHTLQPLKQRFVQLRTLGYDAHLKIGDSTNRAIIEMVRALGPFDLCLIDANHTEPYVRADWANYGSMASIVAFHDIGWIEPPGFKKMPIHVPRVWNEIKQKFRHSEIKCEQGHNGIGVLWRNG